MTLLKLTGSMTALIRPAGQPWDATIAATFHDRFLSRPPNGSNPVTTILTPFAVFQFSKIHMIYRIIL